MDQLPKEEAPLQESLQTPEPSLIKEYDRLLLQIKKIEKNLDAQLIAVVRDHKKWKDQLFWREVRDGYDTVFGYKIRTTSSDGQPRILEVYYDGDEIFIADETGNSLGDVRFFNSPFNDLDKNRIKGPLSVAFNLPNDVASFASNGSSLEDSASTAYGWIQIDHGRLEKERYVRPGMESLPSPIDKAKEVVGMLKRGTITHQSRYMKPDAKWEPFTQLVPSSR